MKTVGDVAENLKLKHSQGIFYNPDIVEKEKEYTLAGAHLRYRERELHETVTKIRESGKEVAFVISHQKSGEVYVLKNSAPVHEQTIPYVEYKMHDTDYEKLEKKISDKNTIIDRKNELLSKQTEMIQKLATALSERNSRINVLRDQISTLTASTVHEGRQAEENTFATAVSSIQKLVNEIDERVVVTEQDEKNALAEYVLKNGLDNIYEAMQKINTPFKAKKFVSEGKNYTMKKCVSQVNAVLSMLCAPDEYHKEAELKRRCTDRISECKKRAKITPSNT